MIYLGLLLLTAPPNASPNGCEDAGACITLAREHHARGETKRAFELAQHACMSFHDGPACSWSAAFAYRIKQPHIAVEHAKKACHLGADCSWAARIAYELKLDDVYMIARTGCAKNDAAACSWAARVAYEQGRQDEAFSDALRGCSLKDYGACTWAARISNEVGLYDDARTYAEDAKRYEKAQR